MGSVNVLLVKVVDAVEIVEIVEECVRRSYWCKASCQVRNAGGECNGEQGLRVTKKRKTLQLRDGGR